MESAELTQTIRRWREHLTETQSFVRLALSFLQSSWPNSERRAHVGALFAVEARTLAMLPMVDVSGLHTGLTPDQSGITPVRPDGVRAWLYLRGLRDRASAWLRALSSAALSGVALDPLVRALDGAVHELLAGLDLLELLLYPRSVDPTVDCVDAIERAAAAVSRTVKIHCDQPTHIAQVRGLLRLVGALLQDATEDATIAVSHTVTRAIVEIPVVREPPSEERASFLRFCAYLGRMTCERDAQRIKLVIPLAIP